MFVHYNFAQQDPILEDALWSDPLDVSKKGGERERERVYTLTIDPGVVYYNHMNENNDFIKMDLYFHKTSQATFWQNTSHFEPCLTSQK